MGKYKRPALQVLVHILLLLPLAVLIWNYTQDQLTAEPIREIGRRTGRYALDLLVLTLATTPVSIVFRIEQVRQMRRLLGLYTFIYASLHFLSVVGLDYRFDFPLIWEDIAQKRYILVSTPAFIILLLLAVTSTKGWMRRLNTNWERLHGLIYIAAALVMIHFMLAVKVGVRDPQFYAVVVASYWHFGCHLSKRG